MADNALLEIARYYLDTVGDTRQATTAVDAILKTYPTSDSAPDAYLIAGRLALARSHQAVDLEAALANFERVIRLFPTSAAVPRSLQFAGETYWYSGRYGDSLANLSRVGVEYPTDTASADASLAAGRTLVSMGDPVSAMEELQQVRNRWPASPLSAVALARLTLIDRLHRRAPLSQAYAVSTAPFGPAKIENVVGLAISGKGKIYWATEQGIGTPETADAVTLPAGVKPRALALDTAGNLVVLHPGALQPIPGNAWPMLVGRPNGIAEPLNKPDAGVQLSNGDWVIADGDERYFHRFDRAGKYIGPFAMGKASRLAVNAIDDVAALDRDQKAVVLYDVTGKAMVKIPFKGTGYDLPNPEDLAFDSFGHLYVLDRGAIAIFSPYPAPRPAGAPAAAAPPAAAPAPAAAARTPQYRLVTAFVEPASATAFRRASAFAVDASGRAYLYDERAQKVLVYQ